MTSNGSKSRFAVAGLQLALPAADNRAQIGREISLTLARYPWVQMVVLAELATYGADLKHAQPADGEAETFYRELAARHRIWLIPGSLYERSGDKVYNMTPVIDPTGQIVARYRKIYPFLPYEKGVAGGTEIVVFDVPQVGRFGVSICYDQWFPEVTRALAWEGAEVVIHPTMTRTIDREQELVIAQANAIFNQCYFLDLNNAGQLGNGRSIFVGPEGEVLHQAGEQGETIPVVLDLEHVRATRRDGLKGLGQVLKSFRDTPFHYPCYNNAAPPSPPLAALGPLELMQREPPGV